MILVTWTSTPLCTHPRAFGYTGRWHSSKYTILVAHVTNKYFTYILHICLTQNLEVHMKQE